MSNRAQKLSNQTPKVAMTCHSVPGAFGEEWLQEPVDLSSRDLLLPKFCQYNNHLLWPHGKAFIYEADTSPEAKLALLKHAKDRKIVGRFEDDLKQQGELQLLPYQAVFARKKGPENERQHGSPRKTTKGEIIGGFHFERSFHRSRPVRDDGSRCYQYQGLSTKKPQAVSSVNANSKLPDDKDHQLWNRMLKTYAAIGVAAMKLAPESVQRAVQLKADLVNSPLIVQDNKLLPLQKPDQYVAGPNVRWTLNDNRPWSIWLQTQQQ
ncbi:hypothetical protein K439DRAFT_1625400 [Ramaria rubella]|nr:hypothetical protein K439DRAFT_1625400 [Ramaria rubella]